MTIDVPAPLGDSWAGALFGQRSPKTLVGGPRCAAKELAAVILTPAPSAIAGDCAMVVLSGNILAFPVKCQHYAA